MNDSRKLLCHPLIHPASTLVLLIASPRLAFLLPYLFWPDALLEVVKPNARHGVSRLKQSVHPTYHATLKVFT